MLRRPHGVSFLLIGVLASVAHGQVDWVGKVILLKEPQKRIGPSGDQSNQAQLSALAVIDYKVLTEKAGRVKVKTHHGAEVWLDKGDVVLVEDAVEYFTDRIRLNPENADLYCCRACAWKVKGELGKAIEDFGTVIRLDPRAYAYQNRGMIWYDKQEFDKSIADFNQAILLDANLAVAFNNRGLAWQAKTVFEKAAADYNEAIRLDPKLAVAYLNRGNVAYARKKYDRALADYSAALHIDPKAAGTYHNRANVWWELLDYDRAIADYSDAVRVDPEYAPAYCNRGAAWQEKKEYGKAIADFSEAVRLDPSLVFAFGSRAWLWATCPDAQHRDGKRAVQSAQRALELAKGDPNLMIILAAAYAESGDYEEAVRWQERALLNPEHRDNPATKQWLEMYRNKMPYRQK